MRALVLYLLGFASAVAQEANPHGGHIPPYERYGTLSLLAGAIGIQYWENRKKDAEIRDDKVKQAALSERVIAALENVTKAVERLGR